MDKISGRVAVKPDRPNDDFETRLKKNLGWKLRKEIPAIAGTDIRPLLQHIKHSEIGRAHV